jgi:hypothetical protein
MAILALSPDIFADRAKKRSEPRADLCRSGKFYDKKINNNVLFSPEPDLR